MKHSVIRARCEPELKARVAAYSARFGLDESDIVRQAVLAYLARNEHTPAPALTEAVPKSRTDVDPVAAASEAIVKSAVSFVRRHAQRKKPSRSQS